MASEGCPYILEQIARRERGETEAEETARLIAENAARRTKLGIKPDPERDAAEMRKLGFLPPLSQQELKERQRERDEARDAAREKKLAAAQIKKLEKLTRAAEWAALTPDERLIRKAERILAETKLVLEAADIFDAEIARRETVAFMAATAKL